jgi:hypothetical protein
VRTLLTYVLAALAAILAAGIVEFADAALVYLSMLGEGSPHLQGPAIASLLVAVPLALVANILLVGPIWFGVTYIARKQGVELKWWKYVVAGAAIYLIVVMLFAQAVNLISSQSLALDGLGYKAALLSIAGAAWGTIFWIRAPKPITAGIAA